MSFFEICLLGNPGYCRILHQDFWLMQIDLGLDLELGIGNYLGFFVAGENSAEWCSV